ncbi:MAG: hypothetical protein K8S99_03530 [Planctomycetes bacterium]|nr:hypothetical protein [Planctomycetota bacterium]
MTTTTTKPERMETAEEFNRRTEMERGMARRKAEAAARRAALPTTPTELAKALRDFGKREVADLADESRAALTDMAKRHAAKAAEVRAREAAMLKDVAEGAGRRRQALILLGEHLCVSEPGSPVDIAQERLRYCATGASPAWLAEIEHAGELLRIAGMGALALWIADQLASKSPLWA